MAASLGSKALQLRNKAFKPGSEAAPIRRATLLESFKAS